MQIKKHIIFGGALYLRAKASEFYGVNNKTIRTWDVNVPEYYNGYCGANGSHVTLIYNAVIKAPLK